MSAHKHTEQKTATDVLINFIMERTKPNGQNFSDKEAHQILKALENARSGKDQKTYALPSDLKPLFDHILRGWSQLGAKSGSDYKTKSSVKDLTIEEANQILGTATKEIAESEKRKVVPTKRADEPDKVKKEELPNARKPKTQELDRFTKPRKA